MHRDDDSCVVVRLKESVSDQYLKKEKVGDRCEILKEMWVEVENQV